MMPTQIQIRLRSLVTNDRSQRHRITVRTGMMAYAGSKGRSELYLGAKVEYDKNPLMTAVSRRTTQSARLFSDSPTMESRSVVIF